MEGGLGRDVPCRGTLPDSVSRKQTLIMTHPALQNSSFTTTLLFSRHVTWIVSPYRRVFFEFESLPQMRMAYKQYRVLWDGQAVEIL